MPRPTCINSKSSEDIGRHKSGAGYMKANSCSRLSLGILYPFSVHQFSSVHFSSVVARIQFSSVRPVQLLPDGKSVAIRRPEESGEHLCALWETWEFSRNRGPPGAPQRRFPGGFTKGSNSKPSFLRFCLRMTRCV